MGYDFKVSWAAIAQFESIGFPDYMNRFAYPRGPTFPFHVLVNRRLEFGCHRRMKQPIQTEFMVPCAAIAQFESIGFPDYMNRFAYPRGPTFPFHVLVNRRLEFGCHRRMKQPIQTEFMVPCAAIAQFESIGFPDYMNRFAYPRGPTFPFHVLVNRRLEFGCHRRMKQPIQTEFMVPCAAIAQFESIGFPDYMNRFAYPRGPTFPFHVLVNRRLEFGCHRRMKQPIQTEFMVPCAAIAQFESIGFPDYMNRFAYPRGPTFPFHVLVNRRLEFGCHRRMKQPIQTEFMVPCAAIAQFESIGFPDYMNRFAYPRGPTFPFHVLVNRRLEFGCHRRMKQPIQTEFMVPCAAIAQFESIGFPDYMNRFAYPRGPTFPFHVLVNRRLEFGCHRRMKQPIQTEFMVPCAAIAQFESIGFPDYMNRFAYPRGPTFPFHVLVNRRLEFGCHRRMKQPIQTEFMVPCAAIAQFESIGFPDYMNRFAYPRGPTFPFHVLVNRRLEFGCHRRMKQPIQTEFMVPCAAIAQFESIGFPDYMNRFAYPRGPTFPFHVLVNRRLEFGCHRRMKQPIQTEFMVPCAAIAQFESIGFPDYMNRFAYPRGPTFPFHVLVNRRLEFGCHRRMKQPIQTEFVVPCAAIAQFESEGFYNSKSLGP